MADTNTTINLEGTDWISDIPGVYFDASSELVKKLGSEQAGNYIARIGLGTGTVIDLTINIIEDPDNLGKIIASTSVAGVTYYISGITVIALTDLAIGAALAITGAATAPVWLTVAGVGAAVAATTYYGSELKEYVYNTLKDSLSDFEEYGFHSPEMVGTITKDAFISQSATNDPDFCKNIFPDYINYRQITEIKSGTESFLYNQLTKDAVITTSQSEKDAAEVIFKNTDADKLTLNSQTFDIRNLSTIQLRNAIDGIDKVSFLLSNITIYVGEKLDLGSHGIYEVQSGDTLSVIAQNNGYVTKDLVKLNPWLIDDNRIQFNYPTKVLVAEGTVISDNVNHTLYGDANAENILIDHNGGDDKLYGGSKNDYIEGGVGNDILYGGAGYDVLLGGNDSDVLYGGAGQDTLIGGDDNASDALFGGSGADVLLGGAGDDTLAGGDAHDLYADKESDYLAGGVGYDIYYVSHQDIINDADSTGFIMFNDKAINGKKTKVDEYTYEDTNFTYTLDGNNLIVVDKNLGEYITIENFQDGAMGINLDEEENTNEPILIKISNPTCQENSWHVAVNNRDFTLEKKVA